MIIIYFLNICNDFIIIVYKLVLVKLFVLNCCFWYLEFLGKIVLINLYIEEKVNI